MNITVPSDFVRRPRSLKDWRSWKATEFRQFLIYTGPVALKHILSRKIYLNFLTLHVAITILVSPTLATDIDCVTFADKLLQHFVTSFGIIYGKEFTSHNIHNLLHLSTDVMKYGPLDTFSAFRFENFIGSIKKYIRKPEKPLQQLARRYAEIGPPKLGILKAIHENKVSYEQPHTDGPTTIEHNAKTQYKKMQIGCYFIYCDDSRNDCCLLHTGEVISMLNIIEDKNNCGHILGKKLTSIESLYSSPCLSKDFNINVVKYDPHLYSWPVTDIRQFYDGLQIVPTIWLRENGKKCLWPKGLNPLHINRAISNEEVLDDKLCETLTVLRIFGKAGTYENGMSNPKLAEKLSEIDTESDGNNNGRQSRHKRAKRTISSSDEEESETCDTVQKKLPPLPKVPKQLQRSITGLTSLDYPEHIEAHKASASRCNSQNRSNESLQQNLDAAANCPLTETQSSGPSTSSCIGSYHSKKSIQEYTDAEPESSASSISKRSHNSEPKKSVQAHTDIAFRTEVLRKLNRISHQLNVLNEKADMQRLRNDSDVEVEETADKVYESYPVQNEEALSSLEGNLESASYAKKSVDCLKKIGGSDLNGVILNILRKLLSDSMAEKYSWAGMRAKKAFKDLNICRVLINTVRKSYSDATEKEIEEITGKWLAQAKVRSARAKAKQDRNSKTKSSTHDKENSHRPNDCANDE